MREALADSAFSADLLSARPVSGGCIHNAVCAEVRDGSRIFVKYGRAARTGMFAAEADGLRALAAATQHLRVPRVLHASETALVLEWIEQAPGPQPGAEVELARGLAELHGSRGSGPQAHRFGFERDNYLGTLPQINAWHDSWPEFWATQRLEAMLRAARDAGHEGELQARGAVLLTRLDEVLAGASQTPSLVHGDLWSGNTFSDAAGRCVLVDPACSYSCREAEFGMLTLFGGVGPRFYAAYDEAFPRTDGCDDRIAIYRLHHLLTHLVLFGPSYRSACLEILRRFT